MPTATRRIVAVVALIVSFGLIVVPRRTDAQIATESARKVVNRVVPAYPDMAGTMNLKRNVKVEVVVGPSGAVKTLEIKGGHPVLAKSARTPFSSASGSLRQAKPGSWSRLSSTLNSSSLPASVYFQVG